MMLGTTNIKILSGNWQNGVISMLYELELSLFASYLRLHFVVFYLHSSRVVTGHPRPWGQKENMLSDFSGIQTFSGVGAPQCTNN